jgi:uncharacterized protein with gpF-like domain
MALTPKPGFHFDPAPPAEALRYLKNKGWKPGFDYRDVWREEHASAFTVAKAMTLDVLGTIRDAVTRALETGRTLQQFKKELRPTLEQLGWWGVQPQLDPKTGETVDVQLGSPRRLETIYRTNLRTAHAAGQWERIEQTQESHPYLIYELGPSKEHRAEHVAWAGTLLPVDDPWWSTHMPPNGWGCKCRVRQVSRGEAAKLGGPTPAPPVEYRDWVNKRTGQVERVPVGIDPGWDVNPGKLRKEAVDRVLAQKLEEADPTVAQTAVRDLRDTGLGQFLAEPDGFFPVLVLQEDAAAAIGAQRRVGVFSAETALKQAEAHPELTPDDYRALADMGSAPMLIVQDAGNQVVIVRRGEKLYWAAVKAARGGGQETFVTTFHETNAGQVRRLVRDGKVLLGKWEG